MITKSIVKDIISQINESDNFQDNSSDSLRLPGFSDFGTKLYFFVKKLGRDLTLVEKLLILKNYGKLPNGILVGNYATKDLTSSINNFDLSFYQKEIQDQIQMVSMLKDGEYKFGQKITSKDFAGAEIKQIYSPAKNVVPEQQPMRLAAGVEYFGKNIQESSDAGEEIKEDGNVPVLTPSELLDPNNGILHAHLYSPIPVILHGKPGVGKTVGINTVAARHQFDMITIILSQVNPEDIGGYASAAFFTLVSSISYTEIEMKETKFDLNIIKQQHYQKLMRTYKAITDESFNFIKEENLIDGLTTRENLIQSFEKYCESKFYPKHKVESLNAVRDHLIKELGERSTEYLSNLPHGQNELYERHQKQISQIMLQFIYQFFDYFKSSKYNEKIDGRIETTTYHTVGQQDTNVNILPSFFPFNKCIHNGIMFFDELNRSFGFVQSKILNLISEGTYIQPITATMIKQGTKLFVRNYSGTFKEAPTSQKMDKHWKIWAAINPKDEHVEPTSGATQRRFAHYIIKSDVTSFLEYLESQYGSVVDKYQEMDDLYKKIIQLNEDYETIEKSDQKDKKERLKQIKTERSELQDEMNKEFDEFRTRIINHEKNKSGKDLVDLPPAFYKQSSEGDIVHHTDSFKMAENQGRDFSEKNYEHRQNVTDVFKQIKDFLRDYGKDMPVNSDDQAFFNKHAFDDAEIKGKSTGGAYEGLLHTLSIFKTWKQHHKQQPTDSEIEKIVRAATGSYQIAHNFINYSRMASIFSNDFIGQVLSPHSAEKDEAWKKVPILPTTEEKIKGDPDPSKKVYERKFLTINDARKELGNKAKINDFITRRFYEFCLNKIYNMKDSKLIHNSTNNFLNYCLEKIRPDAILSINSINSHYKNSAIKEEVDGCISTMIKTHQSIRDAQAQTGEDLANIAQDMQDAPTEEANEWYEIFRRTK